LPSAPASGPATSITAADGSRNSPASVTDAAKPKPASAGIWTSWGMRMNEPNIPKPTSRPVRFVVHTARSRMTRMSTIGSAVRPSKRIQANARMAAAANSATTRDESQPHCGP
jgi:hypothetical protein